MLTDNKNRDQRLRDKLEGFQKTPPLHVWMKVQDELAHQKQVRRIIRLRRMAVAAALLVAFFAGWMVNHRFASVENQQAQTISPAVKQSPLPVTKTGEESNLLLPKERAVTLASNTIPTSATRPTITAQQNSAASETEKLVKTTQPADEKNPLEQLANWIVSPEAENKQTDPTEKRPHTTENKRTTTVAAVDPGAGASIASSKQKLSKWLLKAEMSPLFNTVENTSAGAEGADHSSRATLSGGVTAAYQLTKKLSVKSGIRFAQLQQTTSDISFAPFNADFMLSAPSRRSPQSMADFVKVKQYKTPLLSDGITASNKPYLAYNNQVSQEISYLELPLAAAWQTGNRRLFFGISAGVSANVLVGNQASVSENGIRMATGTTAHLRDMVLSGSAGFELGYGISDRLTISVEPRFKQYLQSVSHDSSIQYNPSQFGIYTGISYKFN